MIRHPRSVLALVGSLLAAGGLVAVVGPVSGAAASGQRRATVTGTVVRPAACPVARAEQPCPTHPVAGAHVSLWRGGSALAATTTDASGQFQLAARPGAAVLRARTSFGGYVARASRDVTLRRGSPVHVRLLLDNGIR